MKNYLNLLFVFAIVGLAACGSEPKPTFNFSCGSLLTEAELKPFEVKKEPKYLPIEFKLLGKLSLAIFDANNRIKSYNVQFFENTRERLVVQVYGIWEPVEMDKAACAVLNFPDYQLPDETLVIFYRNEKTDPKMHIVAGVRKQ
ncbi:MAG: hypothetical protein GC192_01665 [Bacteroidetes bacterium]|nr:hypothetical protein [Bacteroidota bacterium]